MNEPSRPVELPKLEFSLSIKKQIQRIKEDVLELDACSDASDDPYKLAAKAWVLERRVEKLIGSLDAERALHIDICNSLRDPDDVIPF